MAVSITGIMAGAISALTHAVQVGSAYTQGYGTATQHGRVSLERITRKVREATANENFPGAAVFADLVQSWRFPDTLVVWHPTGLPANPAGLPLYNELVVFCPDPSTPNQLLEITSPSDTRTVPALSDTAGWQTALQSIKTASTSNKVILTSLLRVASVTNNGSSTGQRGCVRFELVRHPTAAEWTSYRAGTLTWQNIAWPQDIYGQQSGLSQSWVRIEMQLVPDGSSPSGTSAQQAVPFFGSAALYFTLTK